MGGASLHGLGTGSSTVSGPAPGRPRKRHGRLSDGLRRPAGSAPASPSPSPPPSGFRLPRLARAWRAATFVLAAAFVLLPSVETAQAQTTMKLVSNTGQSDGANTNFTVDSAQAFTTGNPGRFSLTRVDLEIEHSSGAQPTYSVSIHADSSGSPGASLGTLTNPSSLPSSFGLVQFTAPGDGIVLTASTTYFVVVDVSSGDGNTRVRRTLSDAEDSGGATGWGIANSTLQRSNNVMGWHGTSARSLQLAIHGTDLPSADGGKDVTIRSGARVELDGTGSLRATSYAWKQTGGPTVTLDDATSAAPVFIAPTVSSSTALTFSLTVSDGTNRHTDTVTVTVLPTRVKRATVDGDELVVTFDTALDATSKPAGSAFTVTATKSGSSRTIAGTAASVAISGAAVTATLSAAAAADERLTVRYDKPASGAVLKDSGGDALPSFPARPAGNITAGDTTGPRFVSAQANGNKVVYTFDEVLEEGVTPEADRFLWRLDGVNVPSGIAASISGRTVTATFDRAVKHGQVVRVWAYRAIEDAANNITDLSGNLAARVVDKPADNVTPPAYSSASVNGSSLTVTFDGGLDGTSVPAASAFTVKATLAGTQRDVALAATGAVSVSGATVVLTLAETLQRVERVTVAYAAPATGKLRDADKLKLPAPDFAAQTATNNSPADTTKPRFVSTQANGRTLTVTFDELLDASVTPAVGVFSRILNSDFAGTVRSSGVTISGKTVTVTFPTSAGHGNRVRVAHTGAADAANALKDLAGNLVPASTLTFDNNVPNVTPPAYSSASVNGSSLTITFDGALDGTSVPAASAFTVKATRAGTERDVALAATGAVSVSGSTVVLTLAETLQRVETVTVAYAAPATGKLQDADNAKLPVTGFDDTKTATNATPADTTGPVIVSGSVNGVTVVYTFDEFLDESVTPKPDRFQVVADGTGISAVAATISGRTVTATLRDPVGHGQVVKLNYELTNQLAQRLKDLAGNEAAESRSNPATNNTPPAYSSRR